MPDFKCHFCKLCDGRGCVGQMPGMGGPNGSRNFILNFDYWEKASCSPAVKNYEGPLPEIRLGPVTGAVENVGYGDEKHFYFDLISSCCKSGAKISLGDGTPDFKLHYGVEAAAACNAKAAVFIKPYPDDKLYQRIEWAEGVAECCGVDIDSYNIVTMRNLVHLEKKTPGQMLNLKKYLSSKGLPLVIKGVFTGEDIELIKEVKPDVVYVSNHGGRVETQEGSTGAFLEANASVIKNNCASVWIDGGIRTKEHILAAASLGASTVLMGRPFISALCRGGEKAVDSFVKSFY